MKTVRISSIRLLDVIIVTTVVLLALGTIYYGLGFAFPELPKILLDPLDISRL